MSGRIQNSAAFLPVTPEEISERGWDRPDFVLVTGDAYVDHPSFGSAIIGRILEAEGFRVAILSQPDWRSPESFTFFGRPKLGFLVTSGNLDSMVCHYTAARKPRSEDSYTPGGLAGKRPDRAVTVYSNVIRQAYKKMPVIIGGIEASLRRLCHYDYWSDTLKRSILLDSKADMLVYGMAETSIVQIAVRMNNGEAIRDIRDIRGTVYTTSVDEVPHDALFLPDHETLKRDKKAFAESHIMQFRNSEPHSAKILAEAYGSRIVIQNPPAFPLDGPELDRVYELGYMKAAHPSYDKPVPALEEVRFSLLSSRGCFGSCSFCALAFHQGRSVTSRTHESLVAEGRNLVKLEGFKGYIHDVGGPTANFRIPACEKMAISGACTHKNCLFPEPCVNLKADHSDYLAVLRKLRSIPLVKKVYIRSGIRFDYLLEDPDNTFLRELCEHHVSGQLKVAPEHINENVLKMMRKPPAEVYRKFSEEFRKMNEKLGKKQYLIPYLISSHPGSDLNAAIELAVFLRDTNFIPRQVQDFYPAPGTLSSCMYYTGIDPGSMKPVYIPRGDREKRMQRALLQFRDPANHAIVCEALITAGRTDLIGSGSGCLVSLPSGKEKYRKKERRPKNRSRKV